MYVLLRNLLHVHRVTYPCLSLYQGAGWVCHDRCPSLWGENWGWWNLELVIKASHYTYAQANKKFKHSIFSRFQTQHNQSSFSDMKSKSSCRSVANSLKNFRSTLELNFHSGEKVAIYSAKKLTLVLDRLI